MWTGRFRVGVGMEFKKASNHTKKRLVAQSERVAQIVKTPVREGHASSHLSAATEHEQFLLKFIRHTLNCLFGH